MTCHRGNFIDVLPANAGIHFDFFLALTLDSISSNKMDPGFRRDGGQSGRRAETVA
jgi:hypothetical protein